MSDFFDVHTIVSDEEVEAAFKNTNFGSMSHRDVLKLGVLKCSCGLYQGHTSETILKHLDLINGKYEVTPKGQHYLWAAYGQGTGF